MEEKETKVVGGERDIAEEVTVKKEMKFRGKDFVSFRVCEKNAGDGKRDDFDCYEESQMLLHYYNY